MSIVFATLTIILLSCKKENSRIVNNISGKIKSIKLVNHYSPNDSSVTQYDFLYKTNGLLEYLIANDITIKIDSFNLMFNNNLIQKFVDKRTSAIPYTFSDSINYAFNSNNFLETSEHFYTESDACFNKTTFDSFYYNSNNVIKYVNTKHNLGCTASSYYTEKNTYHFFYDVSKINSLTNENIGMQYYGKSSYNIIDSLTLENCNDAIQPDVFDCFYANLKAVNFYDTQGRIIKTNIIPPLGIFMLILKQNLPLFTFSTTDLYEVTYY